MATSKLKTKGLLSLVITVVSVVAIVAVVYLFKTGKLFFYKIGASSGAVTSDVVGILVRTGDPSCKSVLGVSTSLAMTPRQTPPGPFGTTTPVKTNFPTPIATNVPTPSPFITTPPPSRYPYQLLILQWNSPGDKTMYENKCVYLEVSSQYNPGSLVGKKVQVSGVLSKNIFYVIKIEVFKVSTAAPRPTLRPTPVPYKPQPTPRSVIRY